MWWFDFKNEWCNSLDVVSVPKDVINPFEIRFDPGEDVLVVVREKGECLSWGFGWFLAGNIYNSYIHSIYTFHVTFNHCNMYSWAFLCIFKNIIYKDVAIGFLSLQGCAFCQWIISSNKPQESWELHDAVEVGGGDLEERGDVGAFDQVGFFGAIWIWLIWKSTRFCAIMGMGKIDRYIYIYVFAGIYIYIIHIYIYRLGYMDSWDR